MTPEKLEEKKQLGIELIRWLPHDRAYATCLVAWGNSQGLLTDSESKEARAAIDEFYKGDDTVKSNRTKYMGKVLSRIGFQKTKVLWRLIDQLPRRMRNGIQSFELVPNHEAIIRGLKIDSVDYYAIIDNLIDLGYLGKRKDGKKMVYYIDFLQIMAEGNERGVTI